MSVLLVLAIINNTKYNVEDSIVFIESTSSDSIKNGMGFVYKQKDGVSYIVTNYHVIYSSDDVYIYDLNNKKIKAGILEYDEYSDIAILTVEEKLKVAEIGINSVLENDLIYYYNIDKNVIESGNVIGLNNEINVNAGYGNSFYDAISISGNITPGNSGSPILNSDNEVIGLISLKEENNYVAYYLPIDYLMNIVSKLENHTLQRPNLGATFVSTTNIELLNQYGIVVDGINGVVALDIVQEYPLSVSGLIHGDIITKINEVVISDVNVLQKEIYSYNIGDTITLEYYRNNIPTIIDVVLTK